MSLNFKRNRPDTAVDRVYPNAKEIVIARQDVSNRTLLKNPYNNKSDPHDVAGQRPLMKTTDNRGNVFAVSTIEKIEGITNLSLLQNPNRIQEDPYDTPRALSLQVIKDINSGKLPKYIREDRGVNQIAYMLLQFMKDNGVKLATIAMLKSYITGHKLSVLLDKGGQFVTRAFSFFRQLMDASTKLYNKGLLDISLNDLITKYSEGLVNVYGPIILNEVPHAEIMNAIKELGALSGVLSRLFRDQNAIEPNKLVPYEQLVGLPPNPSPVVDPNSGDNEPSPPQNIEEPDNIKQEEKEQERKEWIPESEDPASLPTRIAELRQKLGMPVPPSLVGQAQHAPASTGQYDSLGLMRDATTVGNFATVTSKVANVGVAPLIDKALWGIASGVTSGVKSLARKGYSAATRRGAVPVANQPAAGPPLQSINRDPRLVPAVSPYQPVIPPGLNVETEIERFNRNVVELASRKAYRDIIAGTYTDFGNEDLDSDELIREREYAEFEALNAELIRRATQAGPSTQAGLPTQAGPAVTTKKVKGAMPSSTKIKKASRKSDEGRLLPTASGRESIQAYFTRKGIKNLTPSSLIEYLFEVFNLPNSSSRYSESTVKQIISNAASNSNNNTEIKYALIEGEAERILASVALKKAQQAQQPVPIPKPEPPSITKTKKETAIKLSTKQSKVKALPNDPKESAKLDKETEARFQALFKKFEGKGRKKSKASKKPKASKNIDSQILALLKG